MHDRLRRLAQQLRSRHQVADRASAVERREHHRRPGESAGCEGEDQHAEQGNGNEGRQRRGDHHVARQVQARQPGSSKETPQRVMRPFAGQQPESQPVDGFVQRDGQRDHQEKIQDGDPIVGSVEGDAHHGGIRIVRAELAEK